MHGRGRDDQQIAGSGSAQPRRRINLPSNGNARRVGALCLIIASSLANRLPILRGLRGEARPAIHAVVWPGAVMLCSVSAER